MIGANELEQNGVADYLEYFSLHQDPFQAGWGPLFDGANRRDQFENLLHLCQFSTSLLAVVGEAGVGKRTFRRELSGRLDASDILVEIEAPVLGNAQQFLIDVVKHFKLPLPTTVQSDQPPADTVKALVLLLSEFGATSEEDDPLKILIVENAHQVDDTTLQSLVKISQFVGNEHRSLHIVLFGEPELRDRLAPLLSDDGMVQLFELRAFDHQELKSYLRFRLDSAGFSGIFPFKEGDIEFLWDISQGVPAAMHDAAREILIELATPAPEEKRLGLPIPHMVIVITLAAALLGVLLYSSDNENISTDLPLATQASAGDGQQSAFGGDGFAGNAPTGNNSARVASKDEAAKDDDEPFPQSSSSPLGEELSGEETTDSAPNETATDNPKDKPVEQNTSPLPDPEKSKPSLAVAKKPAVSLPANSASNESTVSTPVTKVSPAKPGGTPAGTSTIELTPRPKAALPKAEEKPLTLEQSLLAQVESEAMTADERQLLNRPPDTYTLQVLAGASRDAVEDFVAKQANRADLKIYSAYRKGKTNYIVVAGSFTNAEAARAGIDTLPDSQRRAGAWARIAQSVQADIKEYRRLE